MITVPNKTILDMLPNTPADKEYALIQDEAKMYQYIAEDKEWKPVVIEGDGLKLSLYDINQNIFAQLEPMTDEALRQVHSQVYKFLGDTMQNVDNDYWALICWNRHYITIFHNNNNLKSNKNSEELSDVFMEIIEELGDVKDVTENDHGALEIWITDEQGTECYLFFNYKNGVVEGIA